MGDIDGYSRDADTAYKYTRLRPEPWWGLLWLPEFWISDILAILFFLNLRFGKRPLRARARAYPPSPNKKQNTSENLARPITFVIQTS